MEDWLVRKEFHGTRGFSDAVAKRFDWLTSNQITLARVAFALPMFLAFWKGLIVTGSCIYAVSCLMDFLDGAVARYQQAASGAPPLEPDVESKMTLREILRHRGTTAFGKGLDPLADKATYFGALIPVGSGFLVPWLIWPAFLAAMALTLFRPIKRRLKLGDTGANRFGKFKMWIEILVIAALVLFPHNTLGWWQANALLALADLFAFLSFIGQVYTARRLLRSS